MHAEQAVFTSMARGGRAGYHLVSRSPGVGEAEARALAAWSPSHGALIVDAANRSSLNLLPMGAGRYALSRTIEGMPEYSGRGGRQLYTHALLFDEALFAATGYQPISLFRAAMALGCLRYQPSPPPALPTVELPRLYPAIEPGRCRERLDALGVSDADRLLARLSTGESPQYRHAGDRIELAGCLFGILPRELAGVVSISTSLVPSPSRPFRLSLIP